MTIDIFVKPFLRLEIFRGLKPLQLTEIARRAYRVTYKPGDIIVREDSPGDAAILIVSGEAIRLDSGAAPDHGEPVPVGALVAEMAMLTEMVHPATIVASSHVRALRIAREDLTEQMLEDPDLADHFMRQISGRLADVLTRLREIDGTLADSAAGNASAVGHFGPSLPGTSPSETAPRFH